MALSWRSGCLIAWALGLLALLVLGGVLFVVKPDLSRWLAGLSPKSACDPAQLAIGGMTFRIQDLARSADGSIPFPADSSGVAYLIQGGSPYYVLALSPATENLKLAASAKPGDNAKITWTDCSSAVYAVSAVEVTSSVAPDAFNQPGAGLTIFVQADASGTGVALRSDLVQAFAVPTQPAEGQSSQTISSPSQAVATLPPTSTAIPPNLSIPTPNPREIQAEIGFQGKQVAASTITLNISVHNYGSKTFTIKTADVHLLPPNQRPVSPSSVDPALPYKVEPQASHDFTFTFPNPGGNEIVFKLLNVEFNLDDF